MKQITRISALLLLMGMSYLNSDAQITVRVRPPRPRVVVTRPPAPSPNHVWVDEDWRVRGRHYSWHGGYWKRAPRAGAEWIPGHWRHRRGGDMWIPGHWRY
jgi:hypothetical protein